jgi:GDP-D-glucose phosphorylase
MQLNSDRATQRRLPQNLQKVNSPFDGTLFNFNKVPAQEVLLKPGNKAAAATSGKIKDNEATDAVVIINVSPLEFGNSLLVPNVTANIPQRITQEGLDLLVRLMLLSTDV